MTTESSTKLTYDDFLLLPDDGRRHEIIDGEHYVTPSPITKHQIISRNLEYLIFDFFQENPLGHIFHAPYDVVFSNTDIVEPDIIYVSRERVEIITEKNIQGAPDLLVEILSESTRKTDEIVKRKLYERFGVKEYWVIDPVLDSIKIYRRSAGSFERVAELTLEIGDTLTTALLPGFAAPLARIFTAL
ncbi:MAG TPA: Uma2 family endonuclease [Thermoanaerobaculia bacterium]|nr:Uma2 family endonuclease [Thermoanaerobaculia bacterium]